MEPGDIAALIVLGPIVAAWICAGIFLCAVILRAAWAAVTGEL